MVSKNIIGVILAAGKGTRMEPISTEYPKPILPICNKPLLQYQIEYMKNLGIKEVIILISHRESEKIVQALGDCKNLGMHIRFIESRETLGIAHAVGKLERYISSPFLLFLGDIFFDAEGLSSMIDALYEKETRSVILVKEEEDCEAIKRNFSVILDENELVKQVIEKPRDVPNKLKGCGVYLFDQSIFDAIRKTPRTAMRDEYEITNAIQIFIDDGNIVRVAPVVKWDINLTDPADMLKCNFQQLKILGQVNVIGRNSQIHPRAKIVNSVVGDNVIVERPIEIINSVIFSDSIISSKYNIRRHIITPKSIVDCGEWFKN